MKTIKLTKGKETMVDDSDYGFLSLINWQAGDEKHGFVAKHASFGRMHRLLVDVDQGMDVDHIDGNPLNNQRNNLRVCTHAENLRNKGSKPGSSSKYLGVSWCKHKEMWNVQLTMNRKKVSNRYFHDEAEAAKFRDTVAQKYHGAFARLNFKEAAL